jgi:hypothetical protein
VNRCKCKKDASEILTRGRGVRLLKLVFLQGGVGVTLEVRECLSSILV